MRNIERKILWQFLDTMSTAIAAAADELHATIEEEPEEEEDREEDVEYCSLEGCDEQTGDGEMWCHKHVGTVVDAEFMKPCAPGTCADAECGKADRTPEEQAAFEAAIPGYLERSGLAAMACNDGCPEAHAAEPPKPRPLEDLHDALKEFFRGFGIRLADTPPQFEHVPGFPTMVRYEVEKNSTVASSAAARGHRGGPRATEERGR